MDYSRSRGLSCLLVAAIAFILLIPTSIPWNGTPSSVRQSSISDGANDRGVANPSDDEPAHLSTGRSVGSSANTPYVMDTLDLFHNSLTKGDTRTANGGGLMDMAYDPETGDIYLTAEMSESLLVVNATTNKWIGGIPLNCAPWALVYDPDTRQIVVNCEENVLIEFNATTLAEVGQETLSYFPSGLFYDAATHAILVPESSGTVQELNSSDYAIIGTWPVTMSQVFCAALDAPNGKLLIGTQTAILVVNASNGALIGNVSVASIPEAIVVISSLQKAYVFSPFDLTVINTSSLSNGGVVLSGSVIEGPALDPLNNQLFLPADQGGFLDMAVYSATTLVQIARLPCSQSVSFPFFVPYGNRVYTVDQGTDNLTMYDANNDSLGQATIPLGTAPGDAVVSPVAGTYLVQNLAQSNISLVNLTSNRVTGWSGSYSELGPWAEDPSNGDVFLLGLVGVTWNLEMLSGVTGTSLRSLQAPGVGDMVYDPTNQYLYLLLTNLQNDTLFMMNTTTWNSFSNVTIASSTNAFGSTGICYDSSNDDIYIVQGGNVTVFSTASRTTVTTFHTRYTALGAITYDSRTGQLYVGNASGPDVYVLNSTTGTVSATLPTAYEPGQISYDPVDNAVFVLSTSMFANTNGTLSEFNATTDSVVTALSVSAASRGFALDHSLVYVTNEYAGTVSVINLTGPPQGYLESVALAPPSATVDTTGTLNLTAAASCVGGTCSTGLVYVWSLMGPGALNRSSGPEVEFTAGTVATTTPVTVQATLNGVSVVATGTIVTIVAPVTYEVNFTEVGLPPGTQWMVTLGGVTGSSATPSISYNVSAGNYSFTAAGVLVYLPTPPSGTVKVSGGPVFVSIAYVTTIPTRYVVSFHENGLLSGTQWSVAVSGMTAISTMNEISFEEGNGSYGYSVGGPQGYFPYPASGTIRVMGGAFSVWINFTSLPKSQYVLAFDEVGLPSGTSWSVRINGVPTVAVTSSSDFMMETNGTYAYAVELPAGFTAIPSTGSVTIYGLGVSVHIQVSENSQPAPNSNDTSTFLGLPGFDGYLVVAGAVSGAAVALALLWGRRRQKTPEMTVPSSAVSPPAPGGSIGPHEPLGPIPPRPPDI